MLHDLEGDVAEEDYDKFQQLFDESEKPLYKGCEKYTKLSAVLKLFNLKAKNGWSDTSFTRYEKTSSTPIVWKLAECNQVGVSESELSEHYVMKWMFDFVTARQFGFPSRFGTLWNDKAPLEDKALAMTISRWAKEFQNKFMNDVVV